MHSDLLKGYIFKIRPGQRVEPAFKHKPADLIAGPGYKRDCRRKRNIRPQKNGDFVRRPHDYGGGDNKNCVQAVKRKSPDKNSDGNTQGYPVGRRVLQDKFS